MPINPYFLTFECLICALFLGSLWHATRRGRDFVLELAWAAIYGFLLEWLTIKQLHAYQYGHFLIMIDDAPVCIGLAWAIIIYTSMEFSDRLQLPGPARPILDALMALNIDIAFDVIAIRLGMWSWNGVGLDQQWFGVPWVNMWAWFIVVWSFSSYIRALRSWQGHRWRRWLYAPFAVLLSLLTLTATSAVYSFTVENLGGGGLAMLLLIVGSLIFVIDCRPRVLRIGLPEPLIIAVPIVFHVFALLAGVYDGVFGKQPVLAAIGAVMLTAGLIVHLLPWWMGRGRQVPL